MYETNSTAGMIYSARIAGSSRIESDQRKPLSVRCSSASASERTKEPGRQVTDEVTRRDEIQVRPRWRERRRAPCSLYVCICVDV